MYGLLLSSLYAPTPKLTFLLSVSLKNAWFTPMIGSGGAIGTLAKILVKTILIVSDLTEKHFDIILS